MKFSQIWCKIRRAKEKEGKGMARNRIKVNPDVLKWAIDESQIDHAILAKRFPKIDQWLTGELFPTFNQLENLSSALHIPFGYLFLQQPPKIDRISTEFRTIESKTITRRSRNLTDTLLSMDQKARWMREYRINEGYNKLPFIGILSDSTNVENFVTLAYRILDIDKNWFKQISDSDQAFKFIRNRIESKGILVMLNGKVGSNTHRKLDPKEFRAFTIVDEYAPLIFINTVDSKNARLFSLMHEFFHLLLGEDDLMTQNLSKQNEATCNKATAEFLAPRNYLMTKWKADKDHELQITNLAKELKVSELVVAIRLNSLGYIDAYKVETIKAKTQDKIRKKETQSKSNFWNTKLYNTSPTFAEAVIMQTKKGITPYTEAFRLLGIRRMSVFNEFSGRILT